MNLNYLSMEIWFPLEQTDKLSELYIRYSLATKNVRRLYVLASE